MKTIKDLEAMKNEKMIPFGNRYDYYIAYLVDLYIAKLDGLSRVKSELSKWDKESRCIIANGVIASILSNDPIDFDSDEILATLE